MFCPKCGARISDEAVICIKCGCAVSERGINSTSTKSFRTLIDTVSQRVFINGVIWIVIAVLQIIAGLTYNWILLIVGGLNIFSAISDIKYSKEIEKWPVGIITKVKPLAGPIIVLIYNLVIGGVIGIAGSIYYLIGVRGYVLENERTFAEIEQRLTSKEA